MNDYFEAFDKGPLSDRGVDAVAPEIYRGIYAMPAFVTIPTDDLAASAETLMIRTLVASRSVAIPSPFQYWLRSIVI